MARVEIDLNVRVRGNLTYSGYEDVHGDLSVGQAVEVYEPESSLTGSGTVVELDDEHRLVYLSVDWAGLHEAPGVSAANLRVADLDLSHVRLENLRTGDSSAIRVRNVSICSS